MLRIVILPLLLFLFSMACMGQTFQYSRGWTNGKRAGGTTSTGYNSLLRKDDEGMSEFFEVQEANERRLERCLLQLQRFIHNPLLLHTASNTLTLNPSVSTSSLGGGIGSSSNINNNNNNNPFSRNHQSNELLEELGVAGTGAIIDTNDYSKH